MIIKNKEEIATSELRKQVLDIIEAGIESALPDRLMEQVLDFDKENKVLKVRPLGFRRYGSFDFSQGRLFVIGAGKAGGLMAEKLEEILGSDNIKDGVAVSLSDSCKTKKIKILQGGHPAPTKKSVRAAEEIMALKNKHLINERDIIICLFSGGGSSLMACPVEGVELKDLQKMTELLINSGAQIGEINIIRKHISKTKGGKLGKFFGPATVVSLIISDVVTNNLGVAASGPTEPDFSTFKDVYDILQKYDLLLKAPKSIIQFLKRGIEGREEETVRNLANCHNYLIGNNRIVLEAMKQKAEKLGFSSRVIASDEQGIPENVVEKRTKEIINGDYADYNILLMGGELNPKLPVGCGRGGRNQHFAALSMLKMEKYSGEWVAAGIATDGRDFVEDTAGAIVDNNSLNQAEEKGLDVKDYVRRYDTNTLFKKLGNSLIITGSTGTNVSDIMVYVLK